jgi:hypothetical protein
VAGAHDEDVEGHEDENQPGSIDTTATILTSEHLELREGLIKQFGVRYQRNEVHWLHYPKRKQR